MRNKGFTLIELVVVIVILGILSATAAPRFLNIQSDAKIAALEGAKGAIAGADGMIFGKAVLEGVESIKEGDKATIEIDGKAVSLRSGHPLMWTPAIPVIMQTDLKYLNSTLDDAHNGVIFYISKAVRTAEEVEASACYLRASNNLSTGVIEYELKDKC